MLYVHVKSMAGLEEHRWYGEIWVAGEERIKALYVEER